MAIKSSLLAAASLMAYLPASNALSARNSGATYLKHESAAYGLVDTYDSTNFFSEFTLFSGADPTEGFVNYQGDQSAASSAGLINTNNNQIYMGVDHTNTVATSSAGRPSIRVTSNKAYTHGLFIADIAHMPGSICGSVYIKTFLEDLADSKKDLARLLACWTQLAKRRRDRYHRGCQR